MPSGKKRKRHKVATHKRKKGAVQIGTKRSKSTELGSVDSLFEAFIERSLTSNLYILALPC